MIESVKDGVQGADEDEIGAQRRINQAERSRDRDLEAETKNPEAMAVALQDRSIEAVGEEEEEIRLLQGIIYEKAQAISSLKSPKHQAVASATALQAEKGQESRGIAPFSRTVISLQCRLDTPRKIKASEHSNSRTTN